MADVKDVIEHHQYLAYLVLFVWTFLEGETIVIFAGIAARDGTPWLPLVILCSFCGSLASDQLIFFLGRHKGKAFIAKRPFWQARAERVYRLLERHQTWLILGFRFLYGLRNITPFAIGMSEVKTRRFVVLNIIGAAIWATSFACGGYLFGAALESFLSHEQKWTVVGGLVVLVLTIWLIRMVRARRLAKRLKEAQARSAQDTKPEA